MGDDARCDAERLLGREIPEDEWRADPDVRLEATLRDLNLFEAPDLQVACPTPR